MLLKPIITEKSMALAQSGQFTFAITPQTNKNQVKSAVEKLFKVAVLKVRVIKLAAKTRRSGKSRQTRQISPRFKAIVTLKSGQTIEYFELPKKSSAKGRSASDRKKSAK